MGREVRERKWGRKVGREEGECGRELGGSGKGEGREWERSEEGVGSE